MELFWSVFSRIWTEYGDLLRKSPYLVQIRENKDHRNSVFKHFLRIVSLMFVFPFSSAQYISS